MKKILYIIFTIIILLSEVWLAKSSYNTNNSNKTTMVTIIIACIFVLYLVLLIKNSRLYLKKDEIIFKILLCVFIIISILKIISLIPIFNMNKTIIQPLEIIEKNYTNYTSFDEVEKIANVDENYERKNKKDYFIQYIENKELQKFIKYYALDSQILIGKENNNGSYSKWVKELNKYGGPFQNQKGSYIQDLSETIKVIQKGELTIFILQEILELVTILTSLYIIKSKD